MWGPLNLSADFPNIPLAYTCAESRDPDHDRSAFMNKAARILLSTLFFALSMHAQQKDDSNCKDHPLFTRMPTYWIHNCEQKEFAAHPFEIAAGKKQTVEGQYWKINYYPQATAKSKPSDLQILRNYENAAKQLGGVLVFQRNGLETFRLNKDGKEVWVQVTADFTGKYGLVIVEKKSMEQDVTADFFWDDIAKTGHVAVYGILFDTGKSILKPESEKAIAEIAKLLKKEMKLNLYVVGHTDNVGNLEPNMKLSQERAAAVVDALVKTHGISAARLKPFGNGPYAPVATNDTDEGRAKNRRVELVKQ
jgi:outer membrane protein OmpA-like peptidoglycan-associated protein